MGLRGVGAYDCQVADSIKNCYSTSALATGAIFIFTHVYRADRLKEALHLIAGTQPDGMGSLINNGV